MPIRVHLQSLGCIKALSIIILLLFGNKPVTAEKSSLIDTELPDYRIQAGDLLKISVLGEDDLFRELRVSANEIISFPLIGEIEVKNKTAYELEKVLTEKLALFLYNPQVSVFISHFGQIVVFGEVLKPGAFELSKKITLLESISLAGGLKEHANQKKIKIIRRSESLKKVILIDLTEIIQNDKKDNDIELQPGDVVIVPQSFL